MKLNIFQRGLLQTITIVFVWLGSITLGAVAVNWVDTQLLLDLVSEAQEQDLIPLDAVNALNGIIEGRDFTVIFAIIVAGLVCGFVGWFFMRRAAKQNWSWPVMLPRAVEFKAAMEQLGIFDPDERVYFVWKHKLQVFITSMPLVGINHKNIRARLYPFAYNSSLRDLNLFSFHTGNQTLCLNASDFDPILEKYGQKTDAVHSARIAFLEEETGVLKEEYSLQATEVDRLTKENYQLNAKIVDYQKKEQTAPARKSKIETEHQCRIVFWRVAASLINRIVEESTLEPKKEKPRRPDIQKLFEQEMTNYPKLYDEVIKVLHPFKSKLPENKLSLDGWPMDCIVYALGDLVGKEPGRSKQTK